MRKVLSLVVVAAVACVVAGVAIPSGALRVNDQTLSTTQFNHELAAIGASPYYQCYLTAKAVVDHETAEPTVRGVNDQVWSTGAAVEWANFRTNQLAVVQFVGAHDPSAIDAGTVADPQVQSAYYQSLYDEIAAGQSAAQSAQSSLQCPGTVDVSSAQATEAGMKQTLPTWFLDDQIQAEAAASALGQPPFLPSGIALDSASLEAWYAQHQGEFETTCLSVIVVADQKTATTVADAVRGGESFAEAAKKYSKDPSTAAKGGKIGCFSPNDTATWPQVVQVVGTVPTGSMSQVLPTSSGYYIFSPTSRTPNSFTTVEDAVRSSVSALNQQGAAEIATSVVRTTDVKVSSMLGTWVATSLGGSIEPPAQPPSSSVLNPSANAPTP